MSFRARVRAPQGAAARLTGYQTAKRTIRATITSAAQERLHPAARGASHTRAWLLRGRMHVVLSWAGARCDRVAVRPATSEARQTRCSPWQLSRACLRGRLIANDQRTQARSRAQVRRPSAGLLQRFCARSVPEDTSVRRSARCSRSRACLRARTRANNSGRDPERLWPAKPLREPLACNCCPADAFAPATPAVHASCGQVLHVARPPPSTPHGPTERVAGRNLSSRAAFAMSRMPSPRRVSWP